jgi:hypothetical protein
MPTEIVLLSDVVPTRELQYEIAARMFPGGAYAEFRGGEVATFTDRERGVLTVHETKAVHERADAVAALKNPPESFGLWTEMTIPYGDPSAGRALAEAIADAVGGQIRERV